MFIDIFHVIFKYIGGILNRMLKDGERAEAILESLGRWNVALAHANYASSITNYASSITIVNVPANGHLMGLGLTVTFQKLSPVFKAPSIAVELNSSVSCSVG